MEVQFAVAKIGKYATSESGDTLEMIERPHGGLSFVLVDGQRSGKSAKAISNLVARKAIQLLSEGVRDGAAARAAHDYLYTYRGGKVSATLNMLSVDMDTKTFVISRNNESPVIVYTKQDGLYLLDEPSRCVGIYRNTKPVITELPILPGTILIVFTDGLRHAGSLSGNGNYDPVAATRQMIETGVTEARDLADLLLAEANEKDNGRPRDDISVLVVSVHAAPQKDDVRRMDVSLPI
ncbi:PP2C family protein-serine/threonine phosphatase [Candidatus Leptofilum sp.]|uniref:PP2C family protein-serine/threonine phosphatase n=1 Tax=Candidatus Leptofilum sp. TaxID=3241576 RepID=UPI003B5C1C1F